MMFRLSMILFLAFGVTFVCADELLYRYEGNVFPFDSSAGWVIFNECQGPCSESLQGGHFILTWAGGGDTVNYDRVISNDAGVPPLPETLWVEWNFRSDQPLGPIFTSRDGRFTVTYDQMSDTVNIYGDAAISFEGGDSVRGLDINEFHTYRFESPDRLNYAFYVDGQIIFQDVGQGQPGGAAYLQFGGEGGVDGFVVNEWDYIRYGTLSDGEAIISSDPSSGFLDPVQYPELDRFTITFDQPGYVYIDDITIEPFSPFNPVVKQTRRFDNGDPETLQIVLDRPLPTDRTVRFVFNTGGTPNTVEYTYLQDGSCCLPNGTCVETTNEQCGISNGSFSAGGHCTEPFPCCLENDTCLTLVPRCCRLIEGTVITTGELCDGDHDMDGVDSACGDNCPEDPFKIVPGLCGCGASEIDSDFDTVPDCIDKCPGEDDRIDNNNNGTPDCVEQIIVIPTVSEWGMVVLVLSLSIAIWITFHFSSGLRTRPTTTSY